MDAFTKPKKKMDKNWNTESAIGGPLNIPSFLNLHL